MIEFYSIYAEMIHAKFEALKSQGFTKEEALELCKTL
jgi:tRNA A58 N-methylase Trm61